MIRLVKLIGRLSAVNLAKSLMYRKKTIVIIVHLCSEIANFWPKIRLQASEIDPILKNKVCYTILIKELGAILHHCTVLFLVVILVWFVIIWYRVKALQTENICL
jgi:uncharacterized membrane protein YwzB